ncbi:MAG TPA: PIN domain-containing protein [Nitrososphaerales archaeon]|nr:PIN domain-containing protein [Nitrososphaerales archaeon]
MSSNLSGIDTNVLCYALDPAFSEHKKARLILKGLSSGSRVAINPTVIHETYHTLVYRQKWLREDVSSRLVALMRQKYVAFLNQTKSISRNAIYLANKYELGGRDSLILSNYLSNNVMRMYTHDRQILELGKVAASGKELSFSDPVI